MNISDETRKSVQEMLNAGNPFTSACISHPLIKQNASVRHKDVSPVIREMWNLGEMIGTGGVQYVRTSITVWPDGPGRMPANAWLYHPDTYDVSQFKPRSRVLIRGDMPEDDSDDAPVSLSNTADGSSISQQCQVQKVNTTLNIPRLIIKKIGWESGDFIEISGNGSSVVVKKASSGKRKVDKEGRIRLYGDIVKGLKTTSPIAMLVTPNGADQYIQVSAMSTLTSSVPGTTNKPNRAVSVWG